MTPGFVFAILSELSLRHVLAFAPGEGFACAFFLAVGDVFAYFPGSTELQPQSR